MSIGNVSHTIQNGLFIVMAACFFFSGSAQASDGEWQFQLAPYGWLSGQKGSVATLPGFAPADIEIDVYDDILGNINSAIMLIGEARKGRFGMFMEVTYTDIEDDISTPGVFFSSITSRTKTGIGTAGVFYRFLERDIGFLDGTGGIRYWSVESELSLNGNLIGSKEISNKESWVDPIVGVKGFMEIGSSQFYVSGFFMIGGFGAGSDLMWDANINLGYQWTTGFATTIGYRHFDVEYEDDIFLYDVAQSGPIVGLSWRF